MGQKLGGWLSRLGFKIAAWSLLLAAIVGISATWYQARLGAADALTAAERDLAGLADSVELATTKALWELDDGALARLLDGLVRDRFVARAEIRSPLKELIADAEAPPNSTPQSDSILLYLLPTTGLRIQENRKLAYNFEGEAVEVGTLTLYSDLNSILADTVARAETVARTSTVITISIVASLIISIFLIVTRPLRAISEYLEAIDIDTLEHVQSIASSVTKRKDEIGTVAGSIDTLLHRILSNRKDLEDSEERYRGLLEGSLQGVTVIRGHQILYANRTAAQIFGFETAEEFMKLSDFRQTFPDGSRMVTLESVRPGEIHDMGEEKRLRKDGSIITVQTMLRRIRWKNVWAIQSTTVDVTDRAKAEQELRRLATRDTLTGLANRTLFRETIINTLDIRPKHKLAVLFININRFKAVNDLLGHEAGDEILVQLAQRLSEVALHSGLIARIEGDKFAIMLDRLTETTEILDVAKKVHKAIEEPIVLPDQDALELTSSIGASVWPTDCEDADELIRTAEISMFAAKSEINRDVKLFDSSLDEALHKTLSLEKEIRAALNQGEFYLEFQPKINRVKNCLCGCEALLRWRRPNGEIVPPATFIPVAEDTGLIVPLGKKVMEMAAAQAADWRDRLGQQIPIAVNVSAVQFTNSDVLADYRQALSDHGLEASLLHIEVTESATMQSLDKILPILQALKDMGTAIAIDDFGTGYSSLSYLKTMPVTHLKLDRSFVTDLPDKDSRTIAKAIVTLGHALNLKVVAEGVETDEQASLLSDYGYNEFQGYFFSKPLSAEDFETAYLQAEGLANGTC